MKKRCLTKAYGGMPLDRIAVERGNGLIYVVNAALEGSHSELVYNSIGFPESAVMEFDLKLFNLLQKQYDASNKLELERLWKMAQPLSEDLPSSDRLNPRPMQNHHLKR